MLNDTLIKSLKFTGKPKKHFDGTPALAVIRCHRLQPVEYSLFL